jgi:hypothetical protein
MSMSIKLSEKREAHIAEAGAIVAKAEAEARDLTTEEDEAIGAALRSAKDLDASIAQHEELEARSIASLLKYAKRQALQSSRASHAPTHHKPTPRLFVTHTAHSSAETSKHKSDSHAICVRKGLSVVMSPQQTLQG